MITDKQKLNVTPITNCNIDKKPKYFVRVEIINGHLKHMAWEREGNNIYKSSNDAKDNSKKNI